VGDRRDAGSVTAELAVALPAVALVLAACVWGLQLASAHVRLQDAAGLAARAAARGDDVAGAIASGAALPGLTVREERDGDLVCARLSATLAGPPGLPAVAIEARSCALDGGR